MSYPKEPQDVFSLTSQAIVGGNRDVPGFTTSSAGNGGGTANNITPNIPADRSAVLSRNIIHWFIPESGVIEMYVNPQSISYSEKKHITSNRTKGGYVMQYWGEELSQMKIQGTTGSSGIEGINVLENIYRSEQRAFDPYALALASDRDAENNDQFSFLGDFPSNSLGATLTGAGKSFLDLASNAIETGSTVSTRAQPTLASLAFGVEMYYSGWVFRGYFTDFSVEEKASNLGLFDYNMAFVVVQRRGTRNNFLGWHRSPTHGPSMSDPEHGPPYSYKSLYNEQATPNRISKSNQGLSLKDALEDAGDFITSIF
jgi:hypothetical protein